MIHPLEPAPTRIETALRLALPISALILIIALALRAALS